jgi:hypothetical protein
MQAPKKMKAFDETKKGKKLKGSNKKEIPEELKLNTTPSKIEDDEVKAARERLKKRFSGPPKSKPNTQS